MAIKINSNIASLEVQRQLGKTTDELSSVFEQLSSGLRINKASDDAAGLAVGLSLNSDKRVYAQAIRNVNDGISALSIASGALSQLTNITTRQKELAEQAASGSYSAQQRQALNAEASALSGEYNRIVKTTTFNGIQLLDGSLATNGLNIQAGYGTQGALNITIGASLATQVGNGTFSPGATFLTDSFSEIVDLNGDGKQDVIVYQNGTNRYTVEMGNGDGTFKATTDNNLIAPMTLADINGDGKLDLIGGTSFLVGYAGTTFALGNGDGTFQASQTFNSGIVGGNHTYQARLNPVTGKVDILDFDNDGMIHVYNGNGNGTFSIGAVYSRGIPVADDGSSQVLDVNGDGILDAVSIDSNSTVAIVLGNADGSFRVAVTNPAAGLGQGIFSDINGDGKLDLISVAGAADIFVSSGNGNGTFQAPKSYATGVTSVFAPAITLGDFNGDGINDVAYTSVSDSTIRVLYGNGDGSFNASISSPDTGSLQSLSSADFNGDGVSDILIAGQQVYIGNTSPTTIEAKFSLLTQSSAQSALNTLSQTFDRISLEQGKIGSYMSRLTTESQNLAQISENYSEAYSRIMDVDVADAASQLVRTQVIQQAATAILAQANQQPALVLTLLR